MKVRNPTRSLERLLCGDIGEDAGRLARIAVVNADAEAAFTGVAVLLKFAAKAAETSDRRLALEAWTAECAADDANREAQRRARDDGDYRPRYGSLPRGGLAGHALLAADVYATPGEHVAARVRQRVDLAIKRERLERRIQELDSLAIFGLSRCEPTADKASRVYFGARRMLAERRRNNAVDALMCLEMAESDRDEDARDSENDRRIKQAREDRHG